MKNKPKLLGTLGRQALHALRFVRFVLHRSREDQVFRVAAALSYTTTLSLVPLTAVMFAIFAAFPAFSGARESLRSLVFDLLIPQAGSRIESWIAGALDATGGLTAFGAIGLLITSILTLNTVEAALNAIYRVAQPRAILSRLLVYWTMLTLGPLLLGASLSLSGMVFFVERTLGAEVFAEIASFAVLLAPSILSWGAFTLIYVVVPHRRVRLRDAAIGGLTAAILFAVLRVGFGVFVAQASAYQTLYGALAVLPIFLIWLYLSWSVVLMGAEMTAALPGFRAARYLERLDSETGFDIALAVDILGPLSAAAKSGAPLKRRKLFAALDAPEPVIEAILERFEQVNLVVEDDLDRLVIHRDLRSVTLNDLVVWLDAGLAPNVSRHARGAVRERLDAAIAAQGEALGIDLDSLLAQSQAETVAKDILFGGRDARSAG